MFRSRKRPVFVACEGSSEAGYIRWLNQLARAQEVAVCFTARDMDGSSPEAIARKAIRYLERKRNGWQTFRDRYLFLDRGREAGSQQVADRAARIAEKRGFGIIWQHLCHECFLLKHFRETDKQNPSTIRDCDRALLRLWPKYKKALDAREYEGRMSLDHLIRARGNLPELDGFLNGIGWR